MVGWAAHEHAASRSRGSSRGEWAPLMQSPNDLNVGLLSTDVTLPTGASKLRYVARPGRAPPVARRAARWVFAAWLSGCGAAPGSRLPNEATEPVDPDRFVLLTRFVHISDAQIVDEESPGRLAAVAQFAANASAKAWRPHEAYSTQLLDGMVRAINKLHVARYPIDFVIHTGDATDNAQNNELDWFITVLDGGPVDPRSGPDDRDPAVRPAPLLDPHHPFEAQGLYRHGVHGDAPTIPWYGLLGNHDRFAVGVFPIVTDLLGRRISPLSSTPRLGIFLPVALDPTGFLSWGPITPAHPGPPAEYNLPQRVQANPARRFMTNRDFIAAHLASTTEPPGHGFGAADPQGTSYSVTPVPGVRLIGLNSASPLLEIPALAYSEGAMSPAQKRFLKGELTRAERRGEIVIVATHHPSSTLDVTLGTALTESSLVRLLNAHPAVKVHLAGHLHEHVVLDRGNYLEITTGSVIDAPQEGRIIEIWRERQNTEVELRYWTFSHMEEVEAPDGGDAGLFDDPLLPMRRVAAELAGTGSR